MSEVRELVTKYPTTAKWTKAAVHKHGRGLETKGGPDLTIARRLIKKAQKEGNHELKGCMYTIVQGACWAPERRYKAGYTSKQVCPLSKEELECVDEKQQFGECTGFKELELKEITDSENWLSMPRPMRMRIRHYSFEGCRQRVEPQELQKKCTF